MGVPQTRADLERHLHDQLGFLHSSAASFDAGFHGEARRLANALRVLLHDTASSRSLLGQLGLKDHPFFDSAHEWDPRNLLTHHGLIGIHASTAGSTYYAPLDDVPFASLESFESWWSKVVFVDDQKRQLTRKGLVLAVANQDGGAHVDPNLKTVYAELSRSNSLGWTAVSPAGERPLADPHFFGVRQIAHEVLVTIEGRIPEMAAAGRPNLTRPVARRAPAKAVTVPGRNDACYCGSGRKYKRCHGKG